MIKNKIILISLLITSCYLLITCASAQSNPEFIISWRALNYVPSEYQGKTFPSNSTLIEAGFDFIVNGKTVNLSRSFIQWKVDGSYIKSGNGIKTVIFPNKGAEQTVRIITEYGGATFDKVFAIPSMKPEVVIDIKSPYKNISLGEYTFTAIPYFFNISNLSELLFQWTSDGQAITGQPDNPESLILNLSSEGTAQETKETELNMSVSIQNIFNQLEVARETVNLIIR